jgi:hypothetical protein
MDTARHHLQPVIQARVPALLPHLSTRDTSHRHHGYLQLKCKPRCVTVRKYGTFVGAFIFLSTEEYNCDIFLSTGTEE